MDDTVGGWDVHCHDLGIVNHHRAIIANRKLHLCTLECFHFHAVSDISRKYFAGHDMIEQNLGQIALRVGQQCVECLGRNL